MTLLKESNMVKKTDPGNLKLIGDNLRKLRENRGLTVQQLSDACAIEQTDISRIERGEINITMIILFDLARALDVHPKQLLDTGPDAGY